MVKNSTLFYLVDDIHQSSDILLTPYIFTSTWEEYLRGLLNFLEYDPGPGLVNKTLERARVQ